MTPCNGCCQHQQSIDPSTEPASVDEELTRLGAQTSHLLQAGLLRHRNQPCSLIYTLPPELLITILTLVCTSERAPSWEIFGTPTPQVVVLGSVSSYWRQVVLETPSLWNTVTLVIRGYTSEAKPALLQHHLIHAKNLDVSLDLPPMGFGSTDSHQHQIFNILFAPENAQKVTTLRVKYLPVGRLAKLSQQLPRLHTLVLENLRNEYDIPITFDFHTQPLHRIFLSFDRRIHWELIKLPSSVQELLTHGVPRNVLLEILRQCPNLTKVVNSDSSHIINSSFLTTPLTLGHLETLTWPGGKFLDVTSVQNFSLPVLKHLRLNKDYGLPPSFITFCHQLSGTLTSLELHWFGRWSVSDFENLFLHGLEHLEILKLTWWPLTGLVMATWVLTPSDEEFRRNELKSLPCLRSLVLEAYPWVHIPGDGLDDLLADVFDLLPHYSNNRANDMINLFLELLEKRRAGRLIPFRLDLPMLWAGNGVVVWPDSLRDKFRYISEGRWVEVLQGGQALEWL